MPNLSSAAVVIGALRVNMVLPNDGPWSEWSPLYVFNYFVLPSMPLNVVLREIKCEGVKMFIVTNPPINHLFGCSRAPSYLDGSIDNITYV